MKIDILAALRRTGLYCGAVAVVAIVAMLASDSSGSRRGTTQVGAYEAASESDDDPPGQPVDPADEAADKERGPVADRPALLEVPAATTPPAAGPVRPIGPAARGPSLPIAQPAQPSRPAATTRPAQPVATTRGADNAANSAAAPGERAGLVASQVAEEQTAGDQPAAGGFSGATGFGAAGQAPVGRPAGDVSRLLVRKGDLTVKETALPQALAAVGEAWKVNIVVTADVPSTAVDATFVQTTLQEILESLLVANGCDYRISGQTLIVGRRDSLGGDNPLLETALITLRAANPQEASSLVKSRLSRSGRVESLTSAKALLIADFPDRLAQIKTLVKQFDDSLAQRDAAVAAATQAQVQAAQPTVPVAPDLQPWTFAPKHVSSVQLGKAIAGMLTKEGRVDVHEPTNELTVFDTAQSLVAVRKFVEQRDTPESAIQARGFTLRNARVKMLEEQLQDMLSDQGRLTVSEPDNRLVVRDYPRVIRSIEQFLQEADNAALDVRTVKLQPQYIKADKELEKVVMKLMSDHGKVSLLEHENCLVLTDYPFHLKRVQEYFNQLDVMRRQVRITALIYDMSSEDLWKLGLDWRALGRTSSGNTFQLDSITTSPFLVQPGVVPTTTGAASGVPITQGLSMMSVTKSMDFAAVINALSHVSNSRLLADPSITVVDREKGQIKIVQEIPIQQLTQGGGSVGPIGTTSFKEAGVIMDVAPRIAPDDNIELVVKPEFSRLVGYTEGASRNPILDKRVAETTVWVHNKQTLVMGGLRTRNKIITNNGIPYLKDIRFMYLNKLFSYEERQFRESELVVFIHPEIVTPYYGGSEREEIIGNFSNQDLDRIKLPGETEFDCEYEDGDMSRARVILDETDEPAGQSASAPKRGAATKSSVAANRAGGRSVAPTRDTSAKIARASSPTRLPPARDEADAPPVQVRRSLEERRLEERRSEERRDETQVAADTAADAPATAAPASAEVKKVDSRRVTPRSAKVEAQPTGLNKFIR